MRASLFVRPSRTDTILHSGLTIDCCKFSAVFLMGVPYWDSSQVFMCYTSLCKHGHASCFYILWPATSASHSSGPSTLVSILLTFFKLVSNTVVYILHAEEQPYEITFRAFRMEHLKMFAIVDVRISRKPVLACLNWDWHFFHMGENAKLILNVRILLKHCIL